MFCKSVYVPLTVLGLIIFGLNGCSSAEEQRVSQIVNQQNFDETLKRCGGGIYTNAVPCLLDEYDPKLKKYCEENKLSPKECTQLEEAMLKKLTGYMEKHNKEFRERMDNGLEGVKQIMKNGNLSR